MIGVFAYEKQKEYVEETEVYILSALKEARRRFPRQEPAYENIQHMLVSQIELLQAVHGAYDSENVWSKIFSTKSSQIFGRRDSNVDWWLVAVKPVWLASPLLVYTPLVYFSGLCLAAVVISGCGSSMAQKGMGSAVDYDVGVQPMLLPNGIATIRCQKFMCAS